MKVSRSTRKKLIIVLTLILIILVGTLIFLILNEDNTTFFKFEVNTDTFATGVTEVVVVSNPFSEEIEEETLTDLEVEEQIDEIDSEEVVEETREVVYDNMTIEEIANQLDKSFNDDLSGKGYLYASYCLEKGVDPYLAAAISLEETGCTWGCSYLVKACNNVGGMKGSGCGAYGHFATLDDGIRAFIDNISNNYVAYGLTTADLMNPKYAENPNWSVNVNAYIERIKNK